MKTWSWRQAILKTGMESTTKLVLLALSTYMNDHGEGCYPSTAQIAHDTSLTERAVFTHIKKAELAGFLVRDKRELKGRKWASNAYRAAHPGDDEPRSAENAGMNDIHPTSSNEYPSPHGSFRDEPVSPHGSVRDEPDSVEGCTTFRRGMNDVHTNSPMNTPVNLVEGDNVCAHEKSLPLFAQTYQEVTRIVNAPIPFDGSPVHLWLSWGAIPEVDIYPTIQHIMGRRIAPPKTLKFFNDPIARAIEERQQPLPETSHEQHPRYLPAKKSLSGFGLELDPAFGHAAG